MTTRRVLPPNGGEDAPRVSSPLAGGQTVDLVALATTICRQYRLEYPDEEQRYGDAGVAWCVHDNQHLLHWASEAVNGNIDFRGEVAWLANVLEARDFPVDRLARDLDIGSEVVAREVSGTGGRELAAVLAAMAQFVHLESFRDFSV